MGRVRLLAVCRRRGVTRENVTVSAHAPPRAAPRAYARLLRAWCAGHAEGLPTMRLFHSCCCLHWRAALPSSRRLARTSAAVRAGNLAPVCCRAEFGAKENWRLATSLLRRLARCVLWHAALCMAWRAASGGMAAALRTRTVSLNRVAHSPAWASSMFSHAVNIVVAQRGNGVFEPRWAGARVGEGRMRCREAWCGGIGSKYRGGGSICNGIVRSSSTTT